MSIMLIMKGAPSICDYNCLSLLDRTDLPSDVSLLFSELFQLMMEFFGNLCWQINVNSTSRFRLWLELFPRSSQCSGKGGGDIDVLKLHLLQEGKAKGGYENFRRGKMYMYTPPPNLLYWLPTYPISSFPAAVLARFINFSPYSFSILALRVSQHACVCMCVCDHVHLWT